MDYIKEAEEILISHRKLNDSLKNLNRRREKIINNGKPKDVSSIDYSKIMTQKNNYTEDTFNEIMEIININNDIESTKKHMELVEEILNQIKSENDLLEKFLRLKYIEKPKEPLRKIGKELGYSEESNHTIYEIKKQALREFAIRFFGSKAAIYA